MISGFVLARGTVSVSSEAPESKLMDVVRQTWINHPVVTPRSINLGSVASFVLVVRLRDSVSICTG